jgi:hypothetical protein
MSCICCVYAIHILTKIFWYTNYDILICHVYVVYILHIYWEYFDIPTKIFWYAMHMLRLFITTSVNLFVRILHVFLSNTNWCIWTYVQKNTYTYVLDTCTHMYRICLCTYVILTCQYHIATCQYLIRIVSIWPYLHVPKRILANGSLLLPPVPICSPAFACALASGRYSSLARRRTVAALLLRQFCRAAAGSAGAGK